MEGQIVNLSAPRNSLRQRDDTTRRLRKDLSDVNLVCLIIAGLYPAMGRLASRGSARPESNELVATTHRSAQAASRSRLARRAQRLFVARLTALRQPLIDDGS